MSDVNRAQLDSLHIQEDYFFHFSLQRGVDPFSLPNVISQLKRWYERIGETPKHENKDYINMLNKLYGDSHE